MDKKYALHVVLEAATQWAEHIDNDGETPITTIQILDDAIAILQKGE